ncbi:MAG: N-acetyltransferase [Prevotellaceae bacterium]|nr:N-acetyltransferase [Prevotellaceae bacterium]
MSKVEIKRVETKKDLKRFIQFHYDLYRGNKYDAPTLYLDDINTLSKDRNAAFDFCEAEYFLAYKDGKIAGRVAAIINHRANEKWQKKTVRFGWIDFIDDTDVSKALLDEVEKWGLEKGMDTIQGPLGFTDMDPEGMLVEGFDELGTMPTIYNYEYYKRHIEALEGYSIDNRYVEFNIEVPAEVPEKFTRVAKLISDRYNLKTRKLTKKDIFNDGYGEKIFALINETYKDLYGYSELSERQIQQYIKQYFGFIDLDLVTIIEDGNNANKLVGIGICIPSMSAALQKCHNGRMFPFGWWHLLRALKFRKSKGVDLLLVGITPEFRGKGANALLFADLIPRFNEFGFEWAETQVELESNTMVQRQWADMNPRLHKRRNCYAKLLKK